MKKTLFSLFIFVLTSLNATSQTQFWQDDLESGAPSSGTRTPSYSGGSGGPPNTRYFKRTTAVDIAAISPFYSGIQGSYFWAAEDVDGAPTGTTNEQSSEQNVTWSTINITGKTGLTFSGLFATTLSTVWDHGTSTTVQDYMIVQYNIDGGAWTTCLSFQPNSLNNSNGALAVDSNDDGLGDGAALTNAFTPFTANITGTGNTLNIRCVLSANSLNEEVAFDYFRLFETPACTAPTITANPPNRAICAGNNTNFSVSATGATAYKWQVDQTFSGTYTDLPNAAPYSGVTSNTLTITGATAGMSGYRYRAVAINGAASCLTNSNYGSLTVSALSTSGSQTNVSCFGGSNGNAAISVSGGIGPYASYSWSPYGGTSAIATGLAAGNYTATVTDAIGCTATQSYTITQPPALSGSTVVTNVACRLGTTGAINLTPSGGTPGYTFNWGSGITTEDRTGLAAGTYSVIITDASSCTVTVNATVTQPASAVSGFTVVTNIACNGGTTGAINLTPSGGTPGYTFNWGGGITTEDRTGLAAGTYSVIITDANGCTGTISSTVTQPASALSGTTVVTNVACNGGTNGAINLTPSGGTPGYTFNWGGGITTEDRTGLAAGTYSVIITDANGCTGTVSATVTQPSTPVSGTRVVTNVSCFGGNNGAINLTPSGGTPGYTFNWGSGVTTEDRTGLAAGTYTVVITDANGCTGTVNATVTQPASAVSGTTVVTNIACNSGTNGAINLTPSGGTPGYTFNWGGGITTEDRTGLAAGTYSVIITDANGCTGTVSATVTQPATAVSGTTVVTNVACNGGTNGAINLTPSGGTPGYTFNWGGGITTEDRTGLAAGTYSVIITDANGCTGTVSATVTQSATVVSGTTVVTNVSCFGGTNGAINLTPSGGTGSGYTFNWGGGITTEDRTGLAAGTYSVIVTDANGCTGTVSATVTQPSTPVSGTRVVTNVSCFGGSNGTINLTPSGGTGSGYTYNWGGGITTEDRTGLAAGTYSVVITDANGCTGTVNATVTQPASAVSGTTVVTNVACNGGTNGAINLTPTGGTGSGYTFNWGGGITTEDRTGLAAGAYSVVITDANGCTGTVSATVTQSTAITGTTVVTNVSCNGGSNGTINLTPTGGTGSGYTFNWGGGITTEDRTGLAAGAYSVVITDANGCTGTVNATVTQPTAITATTVVTNVSCFGGTNGAINLTPSGGATGYTFNWGGGITTEDRTGLAAGAYSVIITDANGCTATANATVTQPSSPISGTTVVTNVSCFGGSNGTINLTPSGGTGSYTYNWGSGITTEDRTGLTAGTYSVTITDVNGCSATANATVTQPASAVSGTTAVTGVSCFGGSNGTATVTATGGTGTYTYSWSPAGGTTATASGLTAGAYTVTITDINGCSATANASVTQPASAVSGTTAVTGVSCFGGSNGTATVTAAGGTGTYTYSWSPAGGTAATASGLSAGTYTVTITDINGCSATANASVTQPASAVSGTTAVTGVSCFGGSNGSATVTAAGGTGTYTYSWSPAGGNAATASGLSAGTYSVTITDVSGCSATQSVIITEPAALIISGTQTNASCNNENDGSVNVTASGGTGTYSYQWTTGETSPGITEIGAGQYAVTVTDANGCTATQSFTVTEPVAISSTQTVMLCAGETFTIGGSTYTESGVYQDLLTAAGGCDSTVTTILTIKDAVNTNVSAMDNTLSADLSGAAYQWINCADNSEAEGATSRHFTPVSNGSYAVVITFDGCSDTSDCVAVSTIGLKEVSAMKNVRLFPNPSNGYATVDWGSVSGSMNIDVTDVAGKVIFTTTVNEASSYILNLQEQPCGVYYVRVSGDGSQQVLKMVRQ